MSVELLENNKFLSFFDYVIVGSRLYFSNDTFNAFVEVDLDIEQVVKIEPFIEIKPLSGRRMHTGCILYHKKIYFFYAEKAYVHSYDLETQNQKLIQLENVLGGFREAFVYQDQLYFFPANMMMGLWRYDRQTMSLEGVDWWEKIEEGNDTRYLQLDSYRFAAYCRDKNGIYLVNFESKKITRLETEKRIWEIAFERDCIWYLTRRERNIYVRHIGEQIDRVYPFEKWEKESPHKNQLQNIWVGNGTVLVVSGDTSGIYQVFPETSEMQLICDLSNCKINRWLMDANVAKKKLIGNSLVYSFTRRNIVAVIDIETMESKCVELHFENQEIVKKYIDRINFENGVIMSENRLSLSGYLELCVGKSWSNKR